MSAIDVGANNSRDIILDEEGGLGLGRRLLETLEACAALHGAEVAHIETSAVLTEALALYRSAGWVEVAAFNSEPFADHWFEKRLTGMDPGHRSYDKIVVIHSHV